MKNVILVLSILFIASCGSDNNPTSSNQGKGQMIFKASMYDQYMNKLANQSGLVGQIFDEDKMVQTVYSDEKGLITFQNIGAGIYNFKFFKEGFSNYTNIDTIKNKNIQFVGAGKYYLDNYVLEYVSKSDLDTSYWAIPNISYEIVKNKIPSKVHIKDTLIYDDNSGHPKYIPIYGSGIIEKWSIKLHADFPKILPNPKFTKRIYFSILPNRNSNNVSFQKDFPYNQTSYDWVYESPNRVVLDSLGNNISKNTDSTYTGDIITDSIAVQLYNNIDQTGGLNFGKSYKIYSPKISIKLNY